MVDKVYFVVYNVFRVKEVIKTFLILIYAGMMELADIKDLKSFASNSVRVQISLPVLIKNTGLV